MTNLKLNFKTLILLFNLFFVFFIATKIQKPGYQEITDSDLQEPKLSPYVNQGDVMSEAVEKKF